jgi:hypothetical protein
MAQEDPIRTALGLFHSMVLSGEKMTPQAEEVWQAAMNANSEDQLRPEAKDTKAETVEEQGAHAVVLAEAMEPLVRSWLVENAAPESDGYSIVAHDEVPNLVAMVSGHLVADGFGRR